MSQSSLLIGGASALILVVLTLIVAVVRRRRHDLPYLADDFLFSPTQLAFKRLLERAVGETCEVYGQVRVADIVGVRAGVSRREFERAYARVGERCFDFLICERRTSAILAAVNLIQRVRSSGPLPKDDLTEVCRAAQLPFLRIPEDGDHDRTEIAGLVAAAMRAAPCPAPREPAHDPLEHSDELELLRGLSRAIVDADLDGGPAASETTAGQTSARASGSPVRPSLVKATGREPAPRGAFARRARQCRRRAGLQDR